LDLDLDLDLGFAAESVAGWASCHAAVHAPDLAADLAASLATGETQSGPSAVAIADFLPLHPSSAPCE
jgi:hypothetical protein